MQFAFPGGYSILYLAEDGGIFCADCARGENGSDAAIGSDDPQWNIVDAYVHWEGPPTHCDHCAKVCESEYGDPDDPQD